MMVLHRSSSALTLMPHCHARVVDGMYASEGTLHPFQPPDEAHLRDLAQCIARRVLGILERAALDVDDNEQGRAAGHGGRPDRVPVRAALVPTTHPSNPPIPPRRHRA
ncbi:MAG: transposase [Deltaproteobacteria bacterium]|nr:transposase [Deltaproteobacteria bacterium]